ncbi:hypothetical protein G7K_5110-t1 [Saitoella complicata NRRL Y-17804]|uniref:EF-hand domain-containing protein n=2 Tax=Saitoella complicata (strain BCRC 22490 / CBS 7301 / JCM 7358 / NBRC 10748 / NRRL Y-17804) TaxID=698492 RepID=A0A0E9NM94_SAICN|nr:hypothetical protein G7K_5110-t1 [Saitoella complicata NRRL Y-17804]
MLPFARGSMRSLQSPAARLRLPIPPRASSAPGSTRSITTPTGPSNGGAKPFDPPPIPKRHPIRQFCFRWFGIPIIVAGSGTAAFFAYDAYTYDHATDNSVSVSSLALSPRLGGPNNLPIAEFLVDDEDSPEIKRSSTKPRLVVLGTGWGSIALLKNLDPDEYHVTVISPSNYFLFTPLLPSAAVGTVEPRSLVESIRRIIAPIRGHFLEAKAERIEFSEKMVEVSETNPKTGEVRSFYVPYDKLVVSVGAISNTHGVNGLEHCHFLKTIDDGRKVRRTIMDNFERSVLPTTTEEERKRLLSFIICGGGPTGIEFAAELSDMLKEDMVKYFPKILRKDVSIHVVQSRDHILNTYDESISTFAEAKFDKDEIKLHLNARVKEVKEDAVVFTQKGKDGVVESVVPFGLCLWSTGVGLAPVTEQICATLKNAQKNKHAIETDSHLRVLGAPMGDVYAIGDCATVQNNISEYIVDIIRSAHETTGITGDIKNIRLSYGEWIRAAKKVRRRFPQAIPYLRKLDKLFHEFDKDHSGSLSYDEMCDLLHDIDRRLTSLPATAQRANQQGMYLAKKLNALARARESLVRNEIFDGDIDDVVYDPFEYKYLGSLAYLGNAAVFDFGDARSWKGNLLAMYLWRSVYWSEQVSFRNRVQLSYDYFKRTIWGRDISRF